MTFGRLAASRFPWALLAALMVWAGGGSAHANGRFPAADQLVTGPKDPAQLVLRTTYGLVQSTDGGQSWSWICEAAMGYGGAQDPAIAVTADGSILAGVVEGLSTSHDRACSWAFAAGPLAGQFVGDVSVERADPSRAVALTKTAVTGGGYHVIVAESLDNGQSFSQAGVPLASDLFPLTIDVAPSAPERLYVSGVAGPMFTPVIERSDNRGTSWTRIPLAPQYEKRLPYIGAVDPNDPDRLYVRLDGSDGDELIVSTDGAQSFNTIHVSVMQGDLLGFALSPDGGRIAIGGSLDGLLVAAAADYSFQPASNLPIRSLTWAQAGLYASFAESDAGMTLGLSTDEGRTFSPLYRIREMCVLDCPATTSTTICVESWPVLAATLGADVTCGEGGSSAASTSASSSAGATGAQPLPDGRSSCGCRLAGAGGDAAAWLATMGLLWGAARGRLRGRRN